MNTDGGRMHFATSIDNSQLRSDAAESRNILASIGKAAQEESSRMEMSFSRIATAAGGFFAVGQIKEFTSNIINLRGEIESFEISFNTLLGSDIKGSAMFKDIREFAVNTPMMLKDLASGAQTMLGFNIEAEKVMPMLRAIGDISMGDAQKFNSLTLAFSQMSATGKLMGQDLLQMINAGFNPLSVISEKTGKSIGELKDEMEKGKITVDMVTEAFISATSEGGKFYGMLEKQSNGINGAVSNLQGAFDDMLNDLGTASQGVAVEVISDATLIIKHYHEIGEILASIVGTYGAYRAAIIATEAIRRSVTTIKHADEAAQLYAVMSAEQKAKISKLGLAETSEAYRAAVIAEMKTEMERQLQLAQTTQIELSAAQKRLASAESEKAAAAEKVTLRQAEVEAAYASAAADQHASTVKKIAAESEAQSRAALLAVKLQEQKNAAIAQARALKEAGASQEIIAAKNREIATISEKIAVARAEEVQHSRNIVALRKEMAAQVDATTSKKIANAEIALETAQEELNTASKARNTAAREVQSKAAAVNTAVKKAGTIETALDTAAETANATATGFLTMVKEKLTVAVVKLNAAISANPWALAAAAAVALGIIIYKLTTYQTEHTKAINAAKDAAMHERVEMEKEISTLNSLKTKLENAKKESQEWKDIKDSIVTQFGKYFDGLDTEIQKTGDLTTSYNKLTEAIRASAAARALERYNTNSTYESDVEKELKKINEGLKGKFRKVNNNGAVIDWRSEPNTTITQEYQSQLRKIAAEYLINGRWTGSDRDWGYLLQIGGEFGDSRSSITRGYESYAAKQAAELEILKSYGYNSKEDFEANKTTSESPAYVAKTEAEYSKKDWEDYRKAKNDEYEAMTKAQRESEKGEKLKAEILRADSAINEWDIKGNQKRQESEAKKAATAAAKNEHDNNQIAVQKAERIQKIKEYSESIIQAQTEAELDIRQNEIDLLENGIEKELKQIELNYDRLVYANKQRRSKMLDQIRDIKALEWENANPKAKERGMIFDRSSISDDYLSEENINNLRKEGKNEEADRVQAMLDQLEEYSRIAKEIRIKSERDTTDKLLAQVLTYEQSRFKIEEEYTRKRNDLFEKNDDGSIKTDTDGNKVLRKGATQGNLDELNRQETEALKAVDEQFATREESYKAWCEAIANLSLKQLNEVLEQAKKNLEELEKENPNDPKLATARAKVASVQAAVNKENAKDKLNPGKRTLKEWEDLYKTLNEVEKEFESIGDTVGGVVGDLISECGKFAASTLQIINGIKILTQSSTQAIDETTEVTAKSLSTLEKASVILTVITSAMQIAMQIASLFNHDEKKQKEIDYLQNRIDQLQWELDHQEIGRVQMQYGTAISHLNEALAQSRSELAAGETGWKRLLTLTGSASRNHELMENTAEKLAEAYSTMAYTADKALGADRYKNANEQLKNIAQQQILLQEQINAEASKKDTDNGQIQEWQNKIEELGQQALELINEMVEDIIGDTSTGIAEKLGDAFFDAFEAGEDAAKAWGDKVNDIVADILKRMMVQKFLEEPLGQIFDKYKKKWFPNGEFSENGLDIVIASMADFANELNSQLSGFKAAMDELPDDLKKYFIGDDAEREASQKGIASASQDSVDELNGRLTAIQSHTFSINETTKLLHSTTQSILRSVMNIESETSGFADRFERMEDKVNEMADSLDDIATKGIRLKN